MKKLEEAVRFAQEEVMRTGERKGVFKDGGGYKVAGYRSKDSGKRVGTAYPVYRNEKRFAFFVAR